VSAQDLARAVLRAYFDDPHGFADMTQGRRPRAVAVVAERGERLKEALEEIAKLRLDGGQESCQYCTCDAGGGLYASGEKLEHHEDWCPLVIARRALAGTSRAEPKAGK
jgi:hypothetical protein